MENQNNQTVQDIMAIVRRAAANAGDCQNAGPKPKGPPSLPDLLHAPAPDFDRRSYDMHELLAYRDSTFVTNAYKAMLKRSPDPEGYEHYLQMLRADPAAKPRILAALRYSAEGRARKVRVKGLRWEAVKLLLQKTPGIGKTAGFLFSLNPAAGVKTEMVVQGDRLVQLLEETAEAFRLISAWAKEEIDSKANARDLEKALQKLEEKADTAAVNRKADLKALERKADIEALEKKADIEALEKKADKEALEKKVDMADMDGYLRAVGHVLDQIQSIPRDATENAAVSDGGDTYSGPWLDEFYLSFEDAFRGPREVIRRQMEAYLPAIREVTGRVSVIEAAPALPEGCAVLDLGCGRGEFLDMLAVNHIGAMGIDSNLLMARLGAQRGQHVQHQDMFAFLAELPPKCLAVATAFQVIEHVPFERQLLLLDQIRRVLVPGGMVILETPNPCNILAGAVDFYRDPTHLHPIHPDTLLFMARSRAFSRAGIFYPEPLETPGPVLKNTPGTQFNDLEDYARVARDYALIAYKS